MLGPLGIANVKMNNQKAVFFTLQTGNKNNTLSLQ
jgi:hypothetical protein